MLGALVVTAGVGAAGCSDDGTPDAGSPDASAGDAGLVDGGEPQAVTIQFAARVGSETARCGVELGGLGPDGDQLVQFSDLRFYVHDVQLLRAGGVSVPVALDEESPWQHAGVALVDFEDKTGLCANGTADTRTIVRGTVAEAGPYTGVRFVVGVPFEQNHQDVSSAPAPLNLTSLFWNWQGGYKFLRIDTTVTSTRTPAPVFNIHVGSTGCDGSPAGGVTACENPNRATVELTGAFDPSTSVIVGDYSRLVSGLDLEMNTPASAPGCMSTPSDPECGEIFHSLGLPFGGVAGDQDFFSLE
ncbi:metallo-mystery pair system four-Cys motif protein [Myxococcota bacterium]|nr:metallo-mystery pair system four-Cys motif protein [Myxococcota bacterium]